MTPFDVYTSSCGRNGIGPSLTSAPEASWIEMSGA